MEVIDCYDDFELVFDAEKHVFYIIDAAGAELYATTERAKAEAVWEEFCDNDGELSLDGDDL